MNPAPEGVDGTVDSPSDVNSHPPYNLSSEGNNTEPEIKSKNPISGTLNSVSHGWSQWSWGKSHRSMLSIITDTMDCPTAIVIVIQSFLWTSAITISKSYPHNLLSTFSAVNKASKIGINPLNPLNILIVGAKRTGKTNLVSRFYANAFIKVNMMEGLKTEMTRCRIDVDFSDSTNNNNNTKTQRLYMKLFDGVGFHAITGHFKRNIVKQAHCIILVFDARNEKNYKWFAAWNVMDQIMKIKNIHNGDKKRVPVVVVGSKIDEIDKNIDIGKARMADFDHVPKRVVSTDRIKKDYCIKYNAPYIEVSSKWANNVEQLFQIAAKEAMIYLVNQDVQ